MYFKALVIWGVFLVGAFFTPVAQNIGNNRS